MERGQEVTERRRAQADCWALISTAIPACVGRAGTQVDDAECLRTDPTMHRVVGCRAKEREGASPSETCRQVNRFETEILTSPKEPEVLDGGAGEVD